MKKIFLILILVFTLFLISIKYNSQMNTIKVGDMIPAFLLKDQNGKPVTINGSIGKPMVIYFYPKDDTPGCIREACKFRDDFESFLDLGVLVFGISRDSVESHKKFIEKYKLPFTLLADTKNEVRKLFGVPKSLLFLPGRVTYVIDNKGIVQYIFNSQFGVEKHIENALQRLRELEGNR